MLNNYYRKASQCLPLAKYLISFRVINNNIVMILVCTVYKMEAQIVQAWNNEL